ncbi:MAG: tetratricopeptide repeat protein, partial [Planctomycetota bacterium]
MASVHSTLRRAQKLERSGRLDEALAAFEESDSDDPRLQVQHALALGRADRGEDAVRKIQRARSADPDHPVPALFGAYLALRFGKPDAAGEALRRAEELAPQNPIAPTLRAAEAIVRGGVREGCEALLAGPVTDNLEVLGWVLARVEAELLRAVGSDSGAIPPEPETPRRDEPPDDLSGVSAAKCMRRGERLLETGRPKSAAAYLARAMENKPDEPTPRVLYGA